MPPSSAARKAEAAELFERFTGHVADSVEVVRVDWPDVAARIGEVTAIGYVTVRDGKREYYLHEFAPGCGPDLGIGPDGKQVVFTGGCFRFTDRGFVDKKG